MYLLSFGLTQRISVLQKRKPTEAQFLSEFLIALQNHSLGSQKPLKGPVQICHLIKAKLDIVKDK